jgi:hypothetical protein
MRVKRWSISPLGELGEDRNPFDDSHTTNDEWILFLFTVRHFN